MPKPEIRLKEVKIFGTNMPDGEGSGFYIEDTWVLMRRYSTASIDLVYELAEENRFVVAPRLPGIKMIASGRNNSRKFKIELTGAPIIEQVKQIGQEQDKSRIIPILRPYLQLTAQLRVEVASIGKQIDQGYEHVNKLMPINNLVVKGLDVPFASGDSFTRVRTYVIDGIELSIPALELSPSISTSVRLPNRRSHIIIRPGHHHYENPNLYLDVMFRSGVLRHTQEVSVRGTEIKSFLREQAQHLNSPREVWAAVQKYYNYLRLNFRIRPDSR